MTKTRQLSDMPEDLLQQDWAGYCYDAALSWVSTIKEPDWFVVHGTVVSVRVGRRIDHAWCEQRDVVVDLAMPAGMKIIQRDQYYRLLQSEVSTRYSSHEATALAILNKHHGPWDELEQTLG